MLRRTKDARIALGRIESVMGTTAPDHMKRNARRLAFLADLAKRQRRDDVRDAVRWVGSAPTYAKGWQAEALDWLRLEVR